jgi:flavin-dependent dehydrogenase
MAEVHHHDVLIVGARLAGAATAMLLARAGRRVLVVDQAREGSDTLSTHAFMRGGVIQLSRWGLLDEVRAAAPAVRRTVIRYGGDETVVDIRPTPHVDALYAPRRTTLDPLLVAAARRAGAEVRFGVRVTGLLRDASGRVVGARARDRAGTELELRAHLTVGADGLDSLVAREVEAPVDVAGTHATALVGGYFSGLDVDGYQWLYGDGPDRGRDPDRRRAGLRLDRRAVDRFGELRTLPGHGFGHVLARVAPDWHDRLQGTRQHGPLRGFAGRPGHLRRAWGDGWALVGDAGSFKDPLSTHGMTDALRDAELLADAILEGTRTDLRDRRRARRAGRLPAAPGRADPRPVHQGRRGGVLRLGPRRPARPARRSEPGDAGRGRPPARPTWAPDVWHVIEQSGYARIADGRVRRLDLVCTGFVPEAS